jgi:Zn-dependent protease
LSSIDFGQVFIAFLVLLFSLTVHEAAHALTADRLGDPTARMLGRVSLNPAVHIDPIGTILFPLLAIITGLPVIGWAKPVPVIMRNLQHPRRDFMLVAAAGPVSNLLIAILGAVVLRLMGGAPPGAGELDSASLLNGLLRLAIVMNVLLAVFNMIPIPPLDGGNVLAGLLPPQLAYQFERLRPWGFLLLYLLMFSGVLNAVVWPVAGIIIGLLI